MKKSAAINAALPWMNIYYYANGFSVGYGREAG